MMRWPWLGCVVVLGCAVSEANPGHCSNVDGDAFCLAEHGTTAPFCAVGSCDPSAPDGCVAARPERECWSPCGQGQTAVENDACDGVADGTLDPSTSSSTTSSPSTTDPITTDDTIDPSSTGESCVPADCTDPARPICGPEGLCVGCSVVADPGAACVALDPTQPVCDEDACVACSGSDIGNCGGITPLCDAATHTCVACTYHEHCPASACDIFSGACLDAAELLYVDGDATCPGSGTEDMPYCLIQGAIDSVANGGTAVIRIAQPAQAYDESIEIADGKKIALLAMPGEQPVVQPGTMGVPTLLVTLFATTAYVEGLRFEGNTDTHAVDISGASVVLDRIESVANLRGGLRVQLNATARVRNCIIGADVNNVDAVEVTSATVDMIYTTVVAGGGAVEPAHAVSCAMDSTVTVRNSFFASSGANPEFTCNLAMVSRTASESLIGGNGNVALGNSNANWYVDFLESNFRLGTPPDAVHDTARWLVGDPPIDIDGDLRPTRDDAPDAAGADR